MKKVIVTTTINAPTEAIEKFDAMGDWTLIVIGDQKTPRDYKLKRGIYVPPEAQEKIDPLLSGVIGWNCIQRRNFGFILARRAGADIVATVDDDNIPMDNWGKNLMLGQRVPVNFYRTQSPAFDPVGAAGYRHLWHRGFPLQLLTQREYVDSYGTSEIYAAVQADFWNGDPDIDAICRMEHAPECKFHPIYFPIASNTLSPFNSQNTFLDACCLEDYFMFPGVGRMDDIWASYYLQAQGVNVVYGAPSVIQKRNGHNFTADFEKEVIGYANNLAIVKDLRQYGPSAMMNYLPYQAKRAFELYRKHFA